MSKCTLTTGSRHDRLFRLAADQLDTIWGNRLNALGGVLIRALLAEKILTIISQQDESIPAESIAMMVRDAADFIDTYMAVRDETCGTPS